MIKQGLLVGTFLVVLSSSSAVFAETPEPGSVSPYIDGLREEARDKGKPTAPDQTSDNPDPYIQSVRKHIDEKSPQPPASGESYTEELRKEVGPPTHGTDTPYIDQMRSRLEPKPEGGAIQAVKEGHSELQARKEGNIHHAAGLKFGASLSRAVSGDGAVLGASFDTVYGTGFVPDLELFYEYQPWHSEWFGNFGIFASAGVGVYKGTGVFAVNLQKPDGSGTFGLTSQVKTQLFDIPISVGLSYRFNLFRLVRPFVMAGPTVIGVYEQRNDGADAHTSDSRGIYAAGGASILLDWISRGSSWDLYAEHGIKHYYLTVEYDRLSALSGPVQFTVSGVFAGLTFEF